jgi:hypothetical protein
MNCLIKVSFFLLFASLANGQVTLQARMQRVVAPDAPLLYEVRINKGAITNFSRFELLVPDTVVVEERESSGGSFTFNARQARIIWAITPEAGEIAVEMTLTAPHRTGTYSLTNKYYYLENEGKREVEFEPLVFTVSENAEPTGEDEKFVSLKPYVPPALPMPATKPVNTDTQSPGEMKMYAYQLRKDSKDAFKVGETEKKKALDNLEDAKTILRQAEYINDESLREKVVKQGTLAKDRATFDLQIADKIMALAQSLADDADRIEKESSVAATSTATTQAAAGNAEEIDAAANAVNVNQQAAPAGELIYKIQVGAFGKLPAKSQFRGLGKVAIENENGLFKVLIGNFPSKEAAMQKRNQVVEKGFDAFIVGYKDGVRIR